MWHQGEFHCVSNKQMSIYDQESYKQRQVCVGLRMDRVGIRQHFDDVKFVMTKKFTLCADVDIA